jgi:hypothetical protein
MSQMVNRSKLTASQSRFGSSCACEGLKTAEALIRRGRGFESLLLYHAEGSTHSSLTREPQIVSSAIIIVETTKQIEF